MSSDLLDLLACPFDHHALELSDRVVGPDGEIETGSLHCPMCARRYPILDGIPSFVEVEPETTVSESERLKTSERTLRDQQATTYDGGVPEPIVDAEDAAQMRMLKLTGREALVDLGCGTGRLTQRFISRVSRLVGIDFSLESLRVFRRRLAPEDRRRVGIVHGDLFHLPFRDGAFDCAMSQGVFEHLPGLVQTREPVIEAARVLRPDGRFVLGTFNYSIVRAWMSRVMPWLTYGGGYHREGHYAGKIYYRRLDAREARQLMGSSFEVEHTAGARIVPKFILRRGGPGAIALERALQSAPFSDALGYFIMVSARRAGGRP